MKRGTWGDDPEELFALSTNGVIRTATLLRHGVAGGTIAGRCRKGGPWQRVLPGVVALHNGSLSVLQRNTAALLYGGDSALISGHAALGIHGYTNSATKSEVLLLIPHTQHRRNFSFVAVERSWRIPEPIIKGTLRIAPVDRCLLDAARRMSQLDPCRALLASGIQRGDVTVDDLAHELRAGSRRGSAVPRTVVRELSHDAHSVAEIAAQKLYATSGLPPMAHNVDVETDDGTWIARPDGWLDSVAVAWEIDSLKYHFSPKAHETTLVRRAAMQRNGIIVVSHLPRQIRDDPATVLADLEAAYHQGTQRPRPPVRSRAD
ncbi:hypothetical protein [Rhodococcus sp. YH1]|uniref:hypothetical protein n=1 Tax=Rhodococcus sp. YH1 TaxID=89066 RepID=UPI001386C427|nr:hypothetical protein [Rhodococcus sp. YH1]